MITTNTRHKTTACRTAIKPKRQYAQYKSNNQAEYYRPALTNPCHAKGGLSACKRPSFRLQFAVFHDAKGGLLQRRL